MDSLFIIRQLWLYPEIRYINIHKYLIYLFEWQNVKIYEYYINELR